MIDLKPFITFLKIVSLLGLVVTCCMIIAILYKKLKEYYPVQVEKYKLVFILLASLLTLLMFYVYQNFIGGV